MLERFCTVISCMDGRIQRPVNDFMRKRFAAEWVDTITEPGPNRILSEQDDHRAADAILDRVKISMERHESVGIAIVGHHDCAGNPTDKAQQLLHLHDSVEYIRHRYPEYEIIALWVNDRWEVEEVG